jgi:hypothetical protein
VEIDKDLSDRLNETEARHDIFKKWLIDNGAHFDSDVIYPAVFANGLVGIAAK